MLMVADARGRGILNADVSTFIPKLFLKSNTFNFMKLSSAFSQLQYLTISILICLCRNLKQLTQARGGIEMLMDADVGEGGIKYQPESADVVYGRSLSFLQSVYLHLNVLILAHISAQQSLIKVVKLCVMNEKNSIWVIF